MEKQKILLINPEDITLHKRRSELNPFAGLAYIATFLNEHFCDNIKIEVIEMLPQHITIKNVLEIFSDTTICGITSKTYNFPFALSLANAIKSLSSHTKIIFGGAHANALPFKSLEQNSIDAIVLREGEYSFKDIVQNLIEDKDPFENVKGILYKKNNDIIENHTQDLIQNLDELPFPNWKKFYNLKKYDPYYDQFDGKFYRLLPIFASRGCPYSCHFCQPLLTRQYRIRSVDNVLDEIEYLKDEFKIKRIYFEDSIFGIKKEWFYEFCNKYISKGFNKKIAWGFETNVNNVDLEQMQLAREANCVYVYFGLESASDVVLKHIGENITKEKIINAIEISKKAGIRTISGSFIFGMPDETLKTAHHTLDFINNSNLDHINVNLLDVYPGTKLYEMVEKNEGGIRWIPEKKDKWDSYGRTVVKTYVNDLDSKRKLETIYAKAVRLHHKKQRRNIFRYVYNLLKIALYFLVFNPSRFFGLTKRFIRVHIPIWLKIREG